VDDKVTAGWPGYGPSISSVFNADYATAGSAISVSRGDHRHKLAYDYFASEGSPQDTSTIARIANTTPLRNGNGVIQACPTDISSYMSNSRYLDVITTGNIMSNSHLLTSGYLNSGPNIQAMGSGGAYPVNVPTAPGSFARNIIAIPTTMSSLPISNQALYGAQLINRTTVDCRNFTEANPEIMFELTGTGWFKILVKFLYPGSRPANSNLPKFSVRNGGVIGYYMNLSCASYILTGTTYAGYNNLSVVSGPTYISATYTTFYTNSIGGRVPDADSYYYILFSTYIDCLTIW
jgi:hypothetical protein